jgi:hypothetical protein
MKLGIFNDKVINLILGEGTRIYNIARSVYIYIY